jgi:homogentisate 1,2-dioxygenase
MQMNKPHKHAECIIAWANGAEIEYRYVSCDEWRTADNPTWSLYIHYRIKPQPVIKKMYMHYDGIEEAMGEDFCHGSPVPQQMYVDNNNMSNHLEFTFTDGKLTSVKIKKT